MNADITDKNLPDDPELSDKELAGIAAGKNEKNNSGAPACCAFCEKQSTCTKQKKANALTLGKCSDFKGKATNFAAR